VARHPAGIHRSLFEICTTKASAMKVTVPSLLMYQMGSLSRSVALQQASLISVSMHPQGAFLVEGRTKAQLGARV
jgi:hypothetical protein